MRKTVFIKRPTNLASLTSDITGAIFGQLNMRDLLFYGILWVVGFADKFRVDSNFRSLLRG